MSHTTASLATALLAPASVAIYGASDDPARPAGRPLRFLRAAGFAGRVYPVNPARQQVQGEAAWPSLAALPEVPEHVFIVASGTRVELAVRDCAALGVRLATVLADGFSEQGPDGLAREEALRRIARNGGLRLLGPSSIGVVNPRNGLLLTANAAFAEPNLPAGRVFCASHSGSMIGALLSRGIGRGIGFAGLVSVGNEVDLSLGEICTASLNDDGIDGYMLFLESLRHARDLQQFAQQAAARGKPVIAYKLGRSEAAARMAITHTGAVAGEDAVADAFLKDCGIARVGVLDALLETLPLARRFALSTSTAGPSRVGVVTTTGGGAAMAVDQLGQRGVTVSPPSDETLARIRAAGIAVRPGPVLDLTLAGTRHDVIQPVLDVLVSAPEFDLVLAVIGSSARFQPDLAVTPLLDTKAGRNPLAVMLVPDAPQALARLTQAQLPCFRSPEACADAIAAVFARRPVHSLCRPSGAGDGACHAWNEFESYALLDRLDIPRAPALRLRFDALLPELPFAYPVAVKLCSASIPHKTDVGGVVLGLGCRESLADAIRTLQAKVEYDGLAGHCDEVMIQPMVAGLGEVLIGYRVDPDVGPIVMLAAGGIWAEVASDRSIRLAPVSVQEAEAMVREVKMLQVFTGRRGQPAADLQALARAVSALSSLAINDDRIQEVEINPLLLRTDGVVAVDALVLCEDRPINMSLASAPSPRSD